MATNDIALYKQVNNVMYETISPKIEEIIFYYEENNEEKTVEIGEMNQVIFINEIDHNWDAARHDLNVKLKLNLSNLNTLFGNDGVTHSENKIGVAAHFHSRTSNYQETVPCGDISNENPSITVVLEKKFQKSFLKGKVECTLFLYLKELNVKESYRADVLGMRFGDLESFTVMIDGEGSMFPILEVEKPGEALWSVYSAWSDIYSEPLDVEFVRVELNKKHPAFNIIMGETKPSKYLLSEVFANAMTQIIYKVVQEEDFDLTNQESMESIASAVSYWISTFEIDTTSLETINYTLRKKLEKQIIL